jgi:predicted PurR-regulated permease PerM
MADLDADLDQSPDANQPDDQFTTELTEQPEPELPKPAPTPVPPPLPIILGRRRSVVASALLFALGAATAYVLLLSIEELRSVLIMLALSLLIALTLDPLVGLMQRGRLPRWLGALLAWLVAVVVLVAPIVLTVNAASSQLPDLIKQTPDLINKAEANLGSVGQRLHDATSSSSGSTSNVSVDSIITYVLKGGEVVFSTVTDVSVVALLSLWLLITLPHLTEFFYRLVPASRREPVERLSTDVLRQVSRFMLANVATSVLAGVATWAWAFGFGIPYALLLGALVAVLDLIPTVGSTVGGIAVSLIALSVNLPTAIATAIFYVAFRLIEDYVIQPRALKFSVELPGVITVPAVLIGAAVLGIPGALFAVPVALVIRVLVRDVAMPELDRR